MVIDRIELNHFRNYEHLQLEPHEGINLFFGRNGSGKTNLLEAIHYCALGKSHRISQDTHAVMTGEQVGGCTVSVRGQWSRNEIGVRFVPGDSAVKTVLIDRKKVKKLSEMMGVLRCVIFSPEDLDLIKAGPAGRRRFLDMMISQISRSYFVALQQYRAAMNHRNAILRQARMDEKMPDSMIEDFEAAMAEYAEEIFREREKYCKMLSDTGNKIYRQISGKEEENFQISSRSSVKWNGTGEFPLKKILQENREEDLKQGLTSAGPQRDDLSLFLNQKSMKLYASQGQMRTAALSMKLSQMKIFTQITGDQPVLLLDDVMSELDLQRRMNLLQIMDGVQTFITCSDEGDLAEYQNHRTMQVSSSEGRAVLIQKKAGPEKETAQLKEPVFD